MSVCDICNEGIASPEGYLLTTRQVVSNPAYWEYAFSHAWSYVNALPGGEQIKGGLAEQQARQRTPWLVCGACAGRLGEATAEARDYARRWWSSAQTFVPPGSGPVPLSAVRLTRTSAAVAESGVPRPARVLLFGRGFLPQKEEFELALQGLIMQQKNLLARDHFLDVPIESQKREAADREAFFTVVEEVRRGNPAAFVLDSLCLDQRTGRDTALLALWEGAEAEVVRGRLGRPPERVGGDGSKAAAARAVAAPRPVPSVAPAAKRRFLSAWTIWSFLPWLCWIAWLHAAIRARNALYAIFIIPYAMPLALAIATSGPGRQLPQWVGVIASILWLVCIGHVFLMRKSVNEKIAARLR